MWRIGFITHIANDATYASLFERFRELGYVEGQNIIVELGLAEPHRIRQHPRSQGRGLLAAAGVAAPVGCRFFVAPACYHFATQLGSTGHHRVIRNELWACRNPYKMGLSDTRRHGLKRPLPNGQFMLGLEPKGQY